MGNRISIQLVSGEGDKQVKSAILFSHSLGPKLLKLINLHILELQVEHADIDVWPLQRFEASYVLLDFIALTLDGGMGYLTTDLTSGDNNDQGHYVIYINKTEPPTYSLERENPYTHDYYIEEIGVLSQKIKQLDDED